MTAPTPVRVEVTYQYRGQTKDGSQRTGRITTADLAEFVRIRHLAGWQWLEVTRRGDDTEHGWIKPTDGGQRAWGVTR